jgi:hypothetical protein
MEINEIEQENATQNQGWDAYREQGLISDDVAEKVEHGEFVSAYSEILSHINESEKHLPPPSFSSDKSDMGVLTAASSSYFPTLELQAISCDKLGVPLSVFDDGMSQDEIDALEKYGVTILKDESGPFDQIDPSSLKVYGAIPPETYFKPFRCLRSPYQKTVWIDSDAILLRDPQFLLSILENRECFATKEAFNPQGATNKLLLGFLGMGEFIPINAGVFGFNRGSKILDLWIATTLFVISHPFLSFRPHCGDQDMLSYAVNLINKELILDNIYCNTPANDLPIRLIHERKDYDIAGKQNRLDAIRSDHPMSYIVHWMGAKKLK